ncbi:hypothetical protein [Cellulomonas sp.]|uniref:hypothetical protein n=1 Tax=Cellulomonas sp. TaxID=40001 RepID=UPI0028118C7B|nr:hypothetical protein [Cellulomonas sp.]
MNLGRKILAGTATAALAFGALLATSTASTATIWTYVGPFGVINEANRLKCESIRKVYIADGIMTKPCYKRNGYYYFSRAL